ncbi:MAG: hypothetical protein JSV13_02225 [Nitrospiraceae bacterium]|nr:MAG: hypothetical protein JSV13_02225 [Nitrospiraceae bacterium]
MTDQMSCRGAQILDIKYQPIKTTIINICIPRQIIGAQIIASDSINTEAKINQTTQNMQSTTLLNPSFQLLATTARAMERTNNTSGDTPNTLAIFGIRCACASEAQPVPAMVARSQVHLRSSDPRSITMPHLDECFLKKSIVASDPGAPIF